jgi:hypothetical protein
MCYKWFIDIQFIFKRNWKRVYLVEKHMQNMHLITLKNVYKFAASNFRKYYTTRRRFILFGISLYNFIETYVIHCCRSSHSCKLN